MRLLKYIYNSNGYFADMCMLVDGCEGSYVNALGQLWQKTRGGACVGCVACHNSSLDIVDSDYRYFVSRAVGECLSLRVVPTSYITFGFNLWR